MVCTLLLSLPSSYETVAAVIENIPDVKYEVVKSKLISEYEKRKINGSNMDSTDPTAFVSQGACFKCGKTGHFKRECPVNMYNPSTSQEQGRDMYTRGRRSYNRGFQRSRGFHSRGFISRGRSRGTWRNYNNPRSNYVQQEQNEKLTEELNEENSVCFMAGVDKKDKVCNKVNLKFFIDSGCTDHMVSDKNYFSDLLLLSNPIKIAVAKSDIYLNALGVGNIKVFSLVGENKIKCVLKNVLYVSMLRKNLLSVNKLEASNLTVIFQNGKVILNDI